MYSLIPLSVFIIMGVIALGSFLDIITSDINFGYLAKSIIMIIIFIVIISKNGLIKNPEFLHRHVPVQILMAEIINDNKKCDAPTLLQVDLMDSGFYTATGIIPIIPFFHTTNIGHDTLPQIRDSQRDAVRDGLHEFVIIHTANENDLPNERHWRFDDNYIKIATLHGAGARDDLWFHLYQRKNT